MALLLKLKQRKWLICCILFFLAIIVVAALFITFWGSPLHVQILSEPNSSDMFTWGDHVSLTAHLSSGIGFFVSYTWSLIPPLNSTYSIVKRSGATLEFVAVDEFYFAVVTYKVHVAYLGNFFAAEANYTLNSYRLRNNSYLINSSAIVSWNASAQLLMLHRSQLPIRILTVGDNLIHIDGLFLVNISQIIEFDTATYSLRVSNTSVAEAFTYFTANGDLLPTTEDDNHLKQELDEIKYILSFTPFSTKRKQFEYSFSPDFSFSIDDGSEVSVKCPVPTFSTQLIQGNLIGQSFRLACQFKYVVSGDITTGNSISQEYTYYLVGDPSEGEYPAGKRFSLGWKNLPKILWRFFKQAIEVRVPLRFKVDVDAPTGVLLEFSANFQTEFVLDYVYTQSGWTIAHMPSVDWAKHYVTIWQVGIPTCNVHVDLEIGLALSHEFLEGLAEISAEFLVHFPWFDAWDPTFKGPAHKVPLPQLCNYGDRPLTAVAGVSVGIEIGLRFWKFGVSTSADYDLAGYLLEMQCETADCSKAVSRYNCTEGMHIEPQCTLDPNGKYQGLAACQTGCGAAYKRYSCVQAQCVLDWYGKYQTIDQCKGECGVCSTCSNPSCCNCPSHQGPCSSSCSFTCPGDFYACCMPHF